MADDEKPARARRPPPRPEDRIDYLAVLKGLGIAIVGLFVINFGVNSVYRALLPERAKQAINNARIEVDALDADLELARQAERAAEDAQPRNEETVAAAQAAREAQEQSRQARIDVLSDEISAAIPTSLEFGVLVFLLLVLGSLAVVAGYFAVRFARGRKPATHGAIAGGGLLLVTLGTAAPLILLLQVGAVLGGGWFGGQIYVRKHGPWDGVMPERPVRRNPAGRGLFGGSGGRSAGAGGGLLGGLFGGFGRGRGPVDEPGDDEADIIDIEGEAPRRERHLSAEPEIVDDGDDDLEGEGPRQFGPRGRKPRRPRPGGTGGGRASGSGGSRGSGGSGEPGGSGDSGGSAGRGGSRRSDQSSDDGDDIE